MAEMTNPEVALPSFQEALDAGELSVQRSKTDPTLFLTLDQRESGGRLTYFRTLDERVTGICMVVPNGFHNGAACFDLGYATVSEFRRQGRGTELVGAAVRDHIAGMKRAGVESFYIEAVVGVENLASQCIASRHLGAQREEIIDSVSGLPAYRFALPIGIEAE